VIHKTVVISGDVEIGEGVTIEPYAVVTGPAWIKDGAYIGAHAVIGAPAQSGSEWPAPGGERRDGEGVVVSPGACIREFVTVHQGVMGYTMVGAGALVMAYCHVSHDSTVSAGATLSTGATLGGFTTIGTGANLGQHAVTHPWVVVGPYAMVGLNTSVIRDVGACEKVAGAPAKNIGMNTRYLVDGEVPESAHYEYVALADDRDRTKAAWEARA